MIIISFETHDLQECCCRIEVAQQMLDDIHAEALITFLADAEALDNAEQLIGILGADADISEDDSLLVKIGANYQARFIAVGVKFVRDEEGRVNWASVQRLKLMEISKSR